MYTYISPVYVSFVYVCITHMYTHVLPVYVSPVYVCITHMYTYVSPGWYIHTCIDMYTYIYGWVIHKYTYTHVSIHTHTYTGGWYVCISDTQLCKTRQQFTHTQLGVCKLLSCPAWIHMYVYAYVYTNICICINVYSYVYIHMYTYMFIETCVFVCIRNPSLVLGGHTSLDNICCNQWVSSPKYCNTLQHTATLQHPLPHTVISGYRPPHKHVYQHIHKCITTNWPIAPTLQIQNLSVWERATVLQYLFRKNIKTHEIKFDPCQSLSLSLSRARARLFSLSHTHTFTPHTKIFTDYYH